MAANEFDELFKQHREAGQKAAAPAPTVMDQTLQANKQGMTLEDLAARKAMLEKGGIYGPGDAGALKLTDSMSFGLLPQFHDLLQGFAGEERMGPKQSDLLKAAQEEYPTGTGVGNVLGLFGPGGLLGKVGKTAFKAGPAVSGAFGAGGANMIDQGVRNETENRPVDLGEAATATIFGGAPGTSMTALDLARKAVPTVGKTVLNRVLPASTRDAASKLLSDVPMPQMPQVPKGLLDWFQDLAGTVPGPAAGAIVTGAERNADEARDAGKRRRSRGGL